MKRMRLDLQAAVGLGDCFDEFVDVEAFDLLGLAEGVASAPLALRCAQGAGRAARAAGRLVGEGGEGGEGGGEGRESFGSLLVADVALNPYAGHMRGLAELGLWRKIARVSRMALRRAQGETAAATEVAFQDLYMNKLTEHFGTDIDRLRQATDDQEPFDDHVMQVVVEALQSHADMFSDKEKAALISFSEAGEAL